MERILDDGELSEAGWQSDILKLALPCGWFAHHTYDSRRSAGDGWPDWVFVKPPFAPIFPELKRWNGALSPWQVYCLNLLTACGMRCYVWRADRLYHPQRVFQEISDILTLGPGQTGRVETTLWVPSGAGLVKPLPRTLARPRKTKSTNGSRPPRTPAILKPARRAPREGAPDEPA